MPADEDLLLALAKGLVGSAANLALPGLGSLIAVGMGSYQGSQAGFNEEISKELVAAFRTVGPRGKASRLTRVISVIKRSEKREARRLLGDGVDVSSVIGVGIKAMDDPGAVDLAALPEVEQHSWAALGQAQLAMARSRAFVPGVWQDEFAALLQTIYEEQMRERGADHGRWRELIGNDEEAKIPSGAQLTDLMRTVTRVFGARMAANPNLETLAEELRQSDRTAMQYALLWRLDQQRQSLQLIAAAACALLIALGIEVEVTQ
jgi:hypothetical protein